MSTFYMDYENGSNTDNTPLGWWKVAFTNGSTTEPIADELCTGDTSASTSNVTIVDIDSGAFATNDAAGTIYFYGKSAAFQSETVSCAGGGDFDIGGDFTYCAWRDMKSGATNARITAGDIIKIAKSSASVSVGNATWTDAPSTLPGTGSITSSTNASPISIADPGHGHVTGDVVYIYNHGTNLTANGTWIVTRTDDNNFTLDGSTGIAVGSGGTNIRANHKSVKLASAATKTIVRCEEAWSADNGATVTLNTSEYKSGYGSCKVVKSSPANDTLYAHFQIGGGAGVDFSSYQKVSFWIQPATAILANDWEICLCSDIAGATPVDTIAIPALPATGEWAVLNIVGDNANLGASIESIALYSGSSAASTSGIYLDNFVACTTSGLNLTSLISKNSAQQGGTEGFYGIQSISEDGKVLRIDNDTDSEPTDDTTTYGMGYSGTTETVTTYKRETIKTDMTGSSTTTINEAMDDGTSGNPIQYQGGYNTADNTQDGETFFDGQNGNGSGISMGLESYLTMNYLNAYRYYYGYQINGSYSTFTNISNSCCNTSNGIECSNSYSNTFTNIGNCNNNGANGIHLGSSSNNHTFTLISNLNNNVEEGLEIENSEFNSFDQISLTSNNGSSSIKLSESFCNEFNSVTEKKSGSRGFNFLASFNNKIRNSTFADNVSASVYSESSENYFYDCDFQDATEFASPTAKVLDFKTYSNNHDTIVGAYKIFTEGGVIESDDGADRHTASGICWKMSITDSERNSDVPMKLTGPKVLCSASTLVTVKMWMKKSHATNIVGKLVCPGGQIAGVASDVVDTKADDTNYEELEVTFTPTVAGVVEIEAHCYYDGGNANIWVDDMTIEQA